MKILNRWIPFGGIVAGLLYGRAPLRAQPASEEPSSPDSELVTTYSGPIVMDDASKPWNRRVSAEDQQVARDLFLEGNRLFRIPLFAKAAEHYVAALAKWKHPAFYFNLALAQLNLGKEVEARENLELALQHGQEPLGAAQFQEAQKQLREIERQFGRIRVTCKTKGAEVTLDGALLFTGPGSYQGWVKAKDHELTAKKSGYLAEARRVGVAAGKIQDVELKLMTLSEASDASRRWATWKPWVVAATGGVIAAAGAGLHALSARNFKAYDEQFQVLECARGPHPPGCTEEDIELNLKDGLLSRAKRQQAIAVGGYIAGGSVIAASIVLMYLNRPRLAEQGVYSLSLGSVTVAPTLAGIAGDIWGVQVSVIR